MAKHSDRCFGKTKRNRRCRNRAQWGLRYCSLHKRKDVSYDVATCGCGEEINVASQICRSCLRDRVLEYIKQRS